MAWWIWVLGGLGLLLVEVTTPGGFFAVFFGAGALLVGGAKALGWTGPAWLEFLAFTALSVSLLIAFRRDLRRLALHSGPPVDRLEGEQAVVVDAVAPGGVGRAELRGSTWTARTDGPSVLERGRRCRIERVDGLTLWVRGEEPQVADAAPEPEDAVVGPRPSAREASVKGD
ncbi:MAG TPA: NfeD family protein [Vicinamibacteria bacterium]|nr:NfeD family protein [Vicinamibacteria bacterium]